MVMLSVLSQPIARAADPAPAAIDPGNVSPTTLKAITVTARYREEDAQKVPIGITSLSDDQLKSFGGSFTLKQIVNQLPSLDIQGFSGRNQTITIRGIGQNGGGTNDGLEQGVGLYVDGVYRPRTGSVITDLIDIESIQLLRGPQGTLFGKNTVAGAVDIRTAEPTFENVGKAELSYGNYKYLRAYLSLTHPITQELTFKVSYLRTSRDGFVHNTVYNQNWDDLDNHSARIDVLWKPSSTFKNRLIGDYSVQFGNVGFQTVVGVLPTTLANGSTVARGFTQRAADVGYKPIAIDPFSRRTDIDSSQYDKMPSSGIQDRIDWRPGADLTLTSITAYRKWQWLPHFDGDGFGANVQTLGIVQTHQTQLSQELRLASPGGQTVDYTAGLYYFWQEMNDYQYTSYGRDASKWLLSASSNPAILNNLTAFSHVIPATNSYAAYGQATYHPTSEWHLTAGLRFTYEHKTGSYEAYGLGDVTPISDLPAAIQTSAANSRAAIAPVGNYADSLNTHNISGTLTVARDIARVVHTYATYSRGYKSSGINLVRKSLGVNVFVSPEKVDDFELGAKTSLLHGRAELNANLFYAIDHDYQANYLNNAVTPLAQYIANVGTLVSKGFEVDARLFPVRGLTSSLSLTYDDARYKDYKNALAWFQQSYLVTQDLSGRRASGAPLWSAAAALEYFAPVSGSAEAYIGADWNLRSKFYAAVNDDPLTLIRGYQVLNAHIGTRDDRARWDLSLWVRNLLDKNYFNTLSVNAANGVLQGALGDPRTVGGTLRLKF
jgi:iron complex outermembrane receptor protein